MKSHQFIVFVFAFVLVPDGYSQQTAEQLYQSALYKEEIEGEMDAAIKIFETVIKQFPENRSVAAKTQLHIGLRYEKLGLKEAQKTTRKWLTSILNKLKQLSWQMKNCPFSLESAPLSGKMTVYLR